MEAFAIHAGFVVPAPRLTMEFRGRVARVTFAVALLLLTSYGAPRLLTHAPSMHTAPAVSRAAAGTKTPFDVDSVVDRASHTITHAPGATSALEVRDAGYRATFDHSGFTYTPTHATTALAVSLTNIARGGHALVADVGAWKSDGNVARRTVSEGVREQVTSTAGSLEWDVVLTAPPADSGPLTVNANLDGVVGTPARVDANTAWKLSLVGGAHVTLGETIVKDATGAELYRALPIVTAGTIKLVVPDSVLTNAAYPVTIDPKVGPRVPVGETYTASDDPAVAFDGTNYLIVWSGYDLEGEDFNIHGARVSGDGSFVQELGQISPTNAGHDSTLPDVAWNGSSYLVVWQYDYSDTDIDIHGQRVAANGALLGGTFTVSNPLGNQRDPAVTAGGATFYVAWGDNRAAATTDIYGGRVSTAGVRLDGNGILVAHETKNDDWPDIAWNGSNFLVVFTFQSSSDSDVHARVVNASAVPVGAVHIIQAGPSRAERAAVASNGTDFFVVWNDFRNSATTSIDIYGARVAGTGTIITGNIAISRASDLQSEPAIAFNGTYLVAWEDRRNSTLDIYADRINANGAVQDGSGFVVETGSTAQLTAPALAAGPGTKWAIDYSWLHPELGASIIHRNIAPK